jgi:acyl-CoA synthetase (AMP-forming)/AMP-acid ligase II
MTAVAVPDELTQLQAAAAQVVAGLTAAGQPLELVEENVLGARMLVFKNRNHSLAELLSASVEYGDRDYLVTAGSRLSFADHAAQVASLAAALRDDYGVRPGDRVAISGANCPEWVVTFWATVALGAVAVGFNAWWSRREHDYALDLVEPRVVVADAKRAALLDGVTVPVLTLDGDVTGLARRSPAAPLPAADVDEDDPATILFTSGTSGRPKGVVHTHRNLLAVVDFHRLNDAVAATFGDPTPSHDKRFLMTMPLFHIGSLHNLTVPRLATGSTAVIHRGAFDVDRICRLIESARVTQMGVVPTMAHRLVEHGDLSGYDLSSIRAVSLASAPSTPALKDRLRTALPVAELQLSDTYGLTESSTAATVASPLELAIAPGCVGRPIVTVQLQVCDDAGQPVPDGHEGEVWLRSPFVMREYWRDPAATAAAITSDRWLRTGDIGMVEQGRLRLSTRRSDLILRGGENVYPAEVEAVLAEHPQVREAAVVGVPHPDLGQEVAAVVVVETGSTVHEDGLRAFVADQLAYFKVPTRWRITTEELPRNATGKVRRTEVSV